MNRRQTLTWCALQGAGATQRWSLAKLLFIGGAQAALFPSAHAAASVLLAEEAPDPALLDVARYLVSEKLDGVRAVWDGRSLRFRSGESVSAPPSWLARLPPHPLDGELWMGRGRFEAVASRVRRYSAAAEDWAGVEYVVYEAPGLAGTFEQRVEALKTWHHRQPSGVWRPAEQRRLPSADQLTSWLNQVLAAGGEGLMLHLADAPYLTGRRPELLKLKPWQDGEAVVLGHQPGQGRLEGLVGALRVRDLAGREFLLGSGLTDAQRAAPPPVGAIVVYRHRGWTRRGLPRFASFWRVRSVP